MFLLNLALSSPPALPLVGSGLVTVENVIFKFGPIVYRLGRKLFKL